MDETRIRQIFREELSLALNTRTQEPTPLTTEEVMEKYSIKSKSTLNSYHRMGLQYVKGNPNRYYEDDINIFFKSNRIKR
jgi:hypothetical protein